MCGVRYVDIICLIAWCKTRVNDRIDYLLVVEYTTMFFTYRTAFHSTKDFGWST